MQMANDTLSPANTRKFRAALLAWFDASKRDLPWRGTQDPYAIWVSEIMLQQTRAAAVVEYYNRFLTKFPSLLSLALAPESEVLAAWSGLGYYRRARMLHKAAQFVVKELKAALPRTAAALRTLPGIGEYTAAAIASIAFDEPVAAVDGNVERVVMRVAALSAEEAGSTAALHRGIREFTGGLVSAARPGDFNQAMMELGATLCLPQRPLCLECPVHTICRTRGEHPVAPRKRIVSREVEYALAERMSKRRGRQVLLVQRPAEETVMPGMWELPQLPEGSLPEEHTLLTVRHAIMTTNYYVRIHAVSLARLKRLLPGLPAEVRWAGRRELRQLPLTGLARKVLLRLGVLSPPARVRPEEFAEAAASLLAQ